MNGKVMKYASVCSGVEAASLAWQPLGWEAAWFSEIEPFPCAVLRERFPNVPNLGDMTKITVENLANGDQKYSNGNGTDVIVPGGVDLLVGGTPCQSFSIAGKQTGLRGVSGLALTFVRLLEAMRCRWFVWENVPGVFSTNGGEDFKTLIRTFDEIGYSLAWRVLDAQYVRVDGFPRAVPQRRRRVFVVGYLGTDWRSPAEVLFESDSVFGNTPPRRVAGKGFTAAVAGGVDSASRLLTGITVTPNGQDLSDTLDASYYKGVGSRNGKERCVVCRATQQGNAESMTDCCPTITEAAGKSGNNQPIICAGFMGGQGSKAGGIAYSEGVAPTIKASPSGGNQVPTIVSEKIYENANGHENCILLNDQGGGVMNIERSGVCVTLRSQTHGNEPIVVCYENHMQDSRVKPCGECSPQINAAAGTGGGNLPLVQECFPINSMIIGKEAKDGDRQTTGIGNAEDPCPTIGTSHHHAVAIAENIIGRKAGNGGNGIGAQEELAYTQNTVGVMGVARRGTVRRLTPLECERLMGFPDNHTRIPWKGKPAENCPDSPRYKACGNSMCVNVMRWIGRRIENVERKMQQLNGAGE